MKIQLNEQDPSQTPVIQFLNLVYSQTCRDGRGNSWQIVNSAMPQALTFCITSRFKFELTDFSYLASPIEYGYHPNGRFGFARWIGKDNDKNYGETFYSLAIREGNLSAYRSFEAWKNRKPFIYLGERLHLGSSVYLYNAEKYAGLSEGSKRVADHSDRGKIAAACDQWKVTSFSEDSSKVNLSFYADENRRPTAHKSVSVAELKALQKIFKES